MRIQLKHLYKAQWKFPLQVSRWVKQNVNGYSLHVCSGSSNIGDVKVDIMPQSYGVTQADMFNLPFKHNTFDTVICDPPWAIGFDKRRAVTYQLRNVLKPNGILLFNGRWIPRIKGLEIMECFISMGFDSMHDVAMWTKYRKVNESF